MNRTIPSRSGRLAFFAATALAGALASPALLAQTNAPADAGAMTPRAIYMHDRANCNSGRTDEDRATCLKEAGAALEARRHGELDTDGNLLANATARCKALPVGDQADCIARIVGPVAPNQRVTTSGSVAGGGILTETTTTTPGAVIVVVPEAPRR